MLISPDGRRAWHRIGLHALALAGLACVVTIWMVPVLRDITGVIPGDGPGDNLTFVWNLWWMRVAVADAHLSFFHCPLIFYPFGVDLTLHTHTALQAFIAAALAPSAPLLASQNVLIAINLFLNCSAAYALAYSLTRHTGGALVAAIVFGCSPYVSAHLTGHFNLIAAWVLPLTALLALIALRGRRLAGWLLGGMLAIAIYTDYYYAVYAVLLVALIAISPAWSFSFDPERQRRPWQHHLRTTLVALLVVDALVVLFIGATGGTVLRVGGARISLLTLTNPLSIAWILLALLAAIWWAPRLSVAVNRALLRSRTTALAIPMAIMTVAAAPLLLNAFELWRAGDYATQRYFWRSAPRGIDAATLLLGNPYGLITGPVSMAAYRRLEIDPIEQIGWIGPAVVVLCLIAVRRQRASAETRTFVAVTLVFLLWSLGPYLMAFGRNTAMILPATAVRFVPIVSNARIPGRAFIVVYMGVAILTASGIAALSASTSRRTRAAALALTALAVLDYLPARPPTFAPGRPAPYDAIVRGEAAGAVLELPLGLRDGFGETGRFDSRTLYYQSIHGRPILGGFVARLAPSVLERYRGTPIVGSLLRLSEGAPLEGSPAQDRARAAKALAALEVRYVVLNRRTAPPDLVVYVNAALPLRSLAQDEELTVYEVVRDSP